MVTRTFRPLGRGAAWLAALLAMACCAAAAGGEMVTRRWGKAPRVRPGAAPRQARKEPPTGYVARTDRAPAIDGRLDEAAWKKAHPLHLASTLDGGARSSQPTEVRLLRDEANLYVSFRCAEPLVGRIQAPRRSHDGQPWSDESVEMFLGSPQRYYHFVVTASGSTYDGQGKNAGWDGRIRAAAVKGRGEWTAELRIPLKPMVGDDVPESWIANFTRNRRTTGRTEEFAWSPTYSGDSHVPSRFGRLLFADPPPPTEETRPVVRKREVTILPATGGEGVVVFDLSPLPKGAKVYRADLRIFRTTPVGGQEPDSLIDIEIHPLFEAFAGGAPAVRAEPLALRAPWHDRFDATDAVRKWAAGTPNGGFFVKVCPRWDPEGTCLDVAYEGPAGEVPKQVSGVRLLHRAGQTFITWTESEPLVAKDRLTWGGYKQALAGATEPVSYRIYAHDRPITAGNLHEADSLAEVGPLSCWNVNGRNREYLIGQAMIASDEMGELARNYNGETSRWHMHSARMDRYPLARFVIDEQAGPLAPGTGLYVHNPARAGRRHYAVVSVRAGVENTKDVSPANAPPAAVAESVGAGEPVRQGKGLWGPYFDYPGQRWVYVQWCGVSAPPLAPRPNMYFNWSVLVPPGAGEANTPVLPGMTSSAKVPAELYFHPDGYSYAQPGQKVLLESIQIAPHDFPASGWYGYNDALGTLKSFHRGKVSNHTQRRIIAFLEWAKKAFPIDADQVISVGSDGAAALALNYPEMFAYVRVTGFDRVGVLDPKAEGKFAAAWGLPREDIKDDRGRHSWKWAHLDELARSQEKDLPLFTCLGASWGGDPGYAKGNGRFYRAMLEARQPLIACWGWNGARNLGDVSKYTGVWWGHRLTRNTPVPAVSSASRDHDQEQSGLAGGGYNWKDVTDAPETFRITLTGGAGTFDFTPRRPRKFRTAPGERVRWNAVSLPGRQQPPGEKLPDPQNGIVAADERGAIVVRGLKYGQNVGGLALTLTKDK